MHVLYTLICTVYINICEARKRNLLIQSSLCYFDHQLQSSVDQREFPIDQLAAKLVSHTWRTQADEKLVATFKSWLKVCCHTHLPYMVHNHGCSNIYQTGRKTCVSRMFLFSFLMSYGLPLKKSNL